MATIDELRKEPHWSYSALNTYLNICQAQYFYRYVEQAEVERTSVCFPFGKAFHAALTAQAWECMMGNSLRQVGSAKIRSSALMTENTVEVPEYGP